MNMKSARILSIPFLFVGLTGAASAFSNGPFSTGKGPYPPVGEEVWKLDTPRTHSPATRAQVVADLHKAERLGQISVGEDEGEGDQVLFKPHPDVSRAQIAGELHEAEQLGLVTNGYGTSPSVNAVQERLIDEAGRQAAEQSKAAAK